MPAAGVPREVAERQDELRQERNEAAGCLQVVGSQSSVRGSGNGHGPGEEQG
jgi:hypothetical protein